MMEQRTTATYVYIGTAVRYLLDSQNGQPVYGRGGLVDNIEKLAAQLESAEFFVSHRLAKPLLFQQDIWNRDAAQHADDQEWITTRGLVDAERRELERNANVLRDAILAEAEGQVAFIASDGRYAVSKLLDDVGGLMGEHVFDGLPALAQYDFQQAGRAIAFDLPTAAAFHLLRGTEAVLRDFYLRTVKRDRIKEPRMWGPMVTALRARRNPPPAVLLTNLDSLRAHFRNPTQHPEKVYDLDEAQDLMALAFDAVARMVRL
jgi:hypothetical protein